MFFSREFAGRVVGVVVQEETARTRTRARLVEMAVVMFFI